MILLTCPLTLQKGGQHIFSTQSSTYTCSTSTYMTSFCSRACLIWSLLFWADCLFLSARICAAAGSDEDRWLELSSKSDVSWLSWCASAMLLAEFCWSRERIILHKQVMSDVVRAWVWKAVLSINLALFVGYEPRTTLIIDWSVPSSNLQTVQKVRARGHALIMRIYIPWRAG